ncbi:Retrovirus-related Pol polyprotein from transposon [Nosema granulosis]|uniref:Retrovirus-related Pol polyprotein from transposon n=1 Tax=Nosema granulosis TaxID=83296 RepID=A0A9P6GW56_9MICR|nr:Retrovirus-related Pol polyprotein from transposon [Nosema granulosis]
MPFGLCNAPATFQSAMDLILKDSTGQFVIPYHDDTIIYSTSVEEHKIHVEHILKKHKELTREAKDSIIKEYHMTLGHGSPSNMKYPISKRYKWPKMFSEIGEARKSCLTCKKFGNQVVNTKNKVIETTQENELWEVDLMGRIDDKGRNKFIFIGIDHFSKWIETKNIKHKTGEVIVKAVEELIINKHGRPKEYYLTAVWNSVISR